ncbi:MAG: recombinase family protein [Beijerinckiaceae bacterium]|nr:recombinase family protein [Brevundimonas sp.]MCZ8302058.1 recombinase family protein [Beijerinckiaceae bacterium]
MNAAKPSSRPVRRCAIYTRKSSEEGLDQGFNSLDAQREACAAYITSQKAEGWKALSTFYDDGGFSGGSMERPALRRLMADIAAGRIDVVVVYKIDRLTRSLADFARMVEIFEQHEVSFVSVTQAFSTTTSMGRLTLNVLLSFAQFEREVTGERIRDKIAASKRKGLWMGGTLPLGYDLPDLASRILKVNEEEAILVRSIFTRYLELGSVHALERDLAARGIRTKETRLRDGRIRGGVAFSRGALFHLLRNRLYRGEIPHKSECHPGQHAAVIPGDLFEAVQHSLDRQTRRRDHATDPGKASSPLTGRLFDADGQPMSPSFAYGRHGTMYRYYVSAPLQQGQHRAKDDPHPRRVPARLLEEALEKAVTEERGVDRLGEDSVAPLERIERVTLEAHRLVVILRTEDKDRSNTPGTRLIVPFELAKGSARVDAIAGDRSCPRRDPVLIRALKHAHAQVQRDEAGLPVLDAAPDMIRARRILRLAFLAPDLQRAILEGRQPRAITLARLIESDIPLLWSEQRRLFAAQA